MMLPKGHKLGPYEIESPAGAGGMGEVYRARDTRLDRTVAIKILPERAAMNADLRARFEREAKIISSLNHPNICTLHDVGHHEGVDYLVMEFLEGESLADRLAKGKLDTAEVLDVGVQVAEALHTAHQKGLIHRDLKPSNVFLTKDGAKLLDFGLAKLSGQRGPLDGVDEKTITTPVTGEGMIVGTLQYMSPEQLESHEADIRSDVFSLGAVLYEMLTGRRAFSGDSSASLIASIMKEEPRSISELRPTAPPALDRLIRKCLQKDPEERWQSAKDLRDELQWIAGAGSQTGIPTPIARKRRLRLRLSWILAALSAVAAAVLGGLLLSREDSEGGTIRLIAPVPEQAGIVEWPQISPDGRLLAFRATDSTGVSRIWIRPLNSLTAFPLSGTERSHRPFWSPDSRHLAYFERGGERLLTIPASGGQARLVCKATGADGNWGTRDVILFDYDTTSPIRMVQAQGGTPRAATIIDTSAGELYHMWPSFLPDGRHFIYAASTRAFAGGGLILKVGSIDNYESKTIGSVESNVLFCEPGYVLYKMAGTLVAHEFDLRARELVGDAIPLANLITDLAASSAGMNVSTSTNGIMVGLGPPMDIRQIGTVREATKRDSTSYLVVADRQGTIMDTLGGPEIYYSLVLSPDETKLAYDARDSYTNSTDIWVRDLENGAIWRLTDEETNERVPAWSPGGDRIAFSAELGDSMGLSWRSASGEGPVVPLGLKSSQIRYVADWTEADELMLLVVEALGGYPSGWPYTGLMQVDHPDEMTTLVVGGSEANVPFGLSPDNRYLLYQQFSARGVKGYVLEVETRKRWQLFEGEYPGWSAPLWRPDGEEIYYLQDNGLMAVSVRFGNTPEFGAAQRLFSVRLGNSFELSYHPYAVTGDGERFYLAVPATSRDHEEIQVFEVVLNWYAELQ